MTTGEVVFVPLSAGLEAEPNRVIAIAYPNLERTFMSHSEAYISSVAGAPPEISHATLSDSVIVSETLGIREPMNVAINPPQTRLVVQDIVVSAAHVEEATKDARYRSSPEDAVSKENELVRLPAVQVAPIPNAAIQSSAATVVVVHVPLDLVVTPPVLSTFLT
jgi:hypothetical protein